jgi:hypothetical protein
MHGATTKKLVCTYFVRVLGWGSLNFARPVHMQDSKHRRISMPWMEFKPWTYVFEQYKTA